MAHVVVWSPRAIREVFAYSYRLIYRVESDQITVAAIVHGKRLLELAMKP